MSFVSQIHDYDTKSTYLQHLNTCTFRINIRRFCPTVIGCYYWNDIPISMREKPTRKLFFFSRAVFMYQFSQHLLMPSFDYVLLIYLLLKVSFLFPLSCMNRFCFIAWKRKFIWCKGHLISFLYYAFLQFSLFCCNYSEVVIVEVKVRY